MLPATGHAGSAFDGFYVGIGVGESLTTGRLNTSTQAPILFPASSTTELASSVSSQNLKRDSWFGSIYGGYGFSVCSFYFGGELSLKYNNHRSLTNTNVTALNEVVGGAFPSTFVQNFNENNSLSFRKVEYALDARPGIFLSTCNLLYGRIGVAFNKVSLNSILNYQQAETGFSSPFPSVIESGSKKVGLRLGLGMEQMFWQCLSLRLDYIYTQYRRINIGSTLPSITSGTGTSSFTDSRNIRPKNHSFMLGLSYYW